MFDEMLLKAEYAMITAGDFNPNVEGENDLEAADKSVSSKTHERALYLDS